MNSSGGTIHWRCLVLSLSSFMTVNQSYFGYHCRRDYGIRERSDVRENEQEIK